MLINMNITAVVFFMLAAFVMCESDDFDDDDDVLILHGYDYHRAIKTFPNLLVFYHAPWCKQCAAINKEYMQAAALLSGLNVQLAKVNAGTESELCAKSNINDFPTLTMFRKGKPTHYSGSAEASKLIEWVKKKIGSPVVPLSSVEEIRGFMGNDTAAIVGFFKDSRSTEAEAYIATSDTIDDTKFGIVTNAQLFPEYGIEKDAAVIVFEKIDNERYRLEDDLNQESISNFVLSQRLPLVVAVTGESDIARQVFAAPIKFQLFNFVTNQILETRPDIDPVLRTIAKEFRGKIIVATLNLDHAAVEHMISFFSLSKSDCPTFRIVNVGVPQMIKFIPDSLDYTVENLRQFVHKVLGGVAQVFLKSDAVPEDWDREPVKVLVGKNFDEVVRNTEKTVFVMFYAYNCEPCKKVEPAFDQLGHAYQDNETIVIAKMNASSNEAKDIVLRTMPTLKLFLKDTNKEIDYPENGDITADAFRKFIDSEGRDFIKKPPAKLTEAEMANLFGFINTQQAQQSQQGKDEL